MALHVECMHTLCGLHVLVVYTDPLVILQNNVVTTLLA